MKNTHKVLSVLLVVLIVLNIIPTFSANSHNLIKPEEKISDTLKIMIDSSTEDEMIPVYIWYKDINQEEVDQFTTERTGLTPEKCNITPNIMLSDNDINKSSRSLSEYISATASLREQEKELCNTYKHEHRLIANEKYIAKSNYIKGSLSINENNVVFCSRYAPMMIVNAYRDDIYRYTKSEAIERISYYNENAMSDDPTEREEEPNYELMHNLVAKENIRLDYLKNELGLTGIGVNIGLLESQIPGEPISGFVDFDVSHVNVVEAPNVTIVPGRDVASNDHDHANNTTNILIGDTLGIAQNAVLYATTTQYDNVEALLDCDIDIIEFNNSVLIYDRQYIDIFDINSPYFTNPQFAYTDDDRYYDHLVSHHHVTTVVAGGNQGSPVNDWFGRVSTKDEQWYWGARIASPGMGHNVITVGGFITNFTSDHEDDVLQDFSWRNSFDTQHGVEKPDVIMSSNYSRGGGTSSSSPALTATLALMLELKPSISLYPQALKAITLASCHRKVNQNNLGNQESINSGITERQGAGVPDAWIMACIICQGTYGVEEMKGLTHKFFIEQPPYESEMMNFSLTWIKENLHDEYIEYALEDDDLVIGRDSNLSLSIYQNNQCISSSDLQYSSTEMCYFELNSQNNLYGIKIFQNDTPYDVRFGYAWSTDNMNNYSGYSEDGIYFIRNKANDRYITESNNQNDRHLTAQNVNFNQNNISDLKKWIVRQSHSGFTIDTAYGDTDMYLSVSNDSNNVDYYAETNMYPTELIISENSDGTYSITTLDSLKILSYKNGKPMFVPHSTHNAPTDFERWYFDRINYRKGDANADGIFNDDDVDFIRSIMDYSVSECNIQRFLADFNNDGLINGNDELLVDSLLS